MLGSVGERVHAGHHTEYTEGGGGASGGQAAALTGPLYLEDMLLVAAESSFTGSLKRAVVDVDQAEPRWVPWVDDRGLDVIFGGAPLGSLADLREWFLTIAASEEPTAWAKAEAERQQGEGSVSQPVGQRQGSSRKGRSVQV